MKDLRREQRRGVEESVVETFAGVMKNLIDLKYPPPPAHISMSSPGCYNHQGKGVLSEAGTDFQSSGGIFGCPTPVGQTVTGHGTSCSVSLDDSHMCS